MMGRHTNADGQQGQADRRRSGVHVVILVGVLAVAGAGTIVLAGVSPADRATSAPAPNGSTAAVPAGRHTLVISVTGRRCRVEVRRPDGDVLLKGTLPHGRTVRFTDPKLDVRLSDGSAAQVYVNGMPLPAGPVGKPASFTASRF